MASASINTKKIEEQLEEARGYVGLLSIMLMFLFIVFILYVAYFCPKDTMAPVNIKSTNRHWRFFSPYQFGFAGPSGMIAGNIDRKVISVSQQQRDEDLAQSRGPRTYKAYQKNAYRL